MDPEAISIQPHNWLNMNEHPKTTTPVSESTRLLDKPPGTDPRIPARNHSPPSHADALRATTQSRAISLPMRLVEPNEEEEAPAVEGLLLLQHMTGSSELPSKRPSMSDSMDTFPPVQDNPIHVLLKKDMPMHLSVDTSRLEMFRGVFVHSNASMHYSIIKNDDELHFLGFHGSSVAAARAWDLAALKRSMDGCQNLSTAKTNFKLEDYVRLENVLSMMVILTFEDLVEMIKDSHRLPCTESEMKEVRDRIGQCKIGFRDEMGDAPLPPELKEERLIQTMNGTALSPDQMRDLISATCPQTQNNAWVKNIRDSKKWKGVYFSTDGVPYSKVEFGGKYHYLGRFDTLEGAARAYDLATLKRAMINNQSIVSLNFPSEDYTKDRKLMEYLYAADNEQVSQFIRMLAQNQRSMNGEYGRGRMASKRQKLDAMEATGRKSMESSVQHIDWDAMGLGKTSMLQPMPTMHEREEPVDSQRKSEMKVERRICDANMAAMLRDSKDWVKVALNAVALKMTPANLTVTTEAAVFPRDVSEWFGVSSSQCGNQCIDLINAVGEQRFKFNCHISRDRCQFSSLDWNHFVDAVGLTVGDILVLLRTEVMWRLNYTVFVLPDAVMAGPLTSPVMHDVRSLSRSSASVQLPSPYVARPSAPQPQVPTRRTVQAHVLPNARSLTSIQVIQTATDGRLLVYASHINDPSNRSFYVIPASSVPDMPTLRPFSAVSNGSTHPQAFGNRRCLPGMLGTVLPAVRPTMPQTPLPTRPACSHSTPIRLNVRGGFKTLDKKTDASLYMVADTNGQMRLVTSQPLRAPMTGRPAPESETAVGYPTHFIPKPTNRLRSMADRLSQTSPEITVIDPSTTGSDASGTGTEKPLHEDSNTKQVIDLVDEDEKDHPAKEEGLPTMYAQVMKILDECRGLDADIVKKYKFAFINKMPSGQQTANLMELKHLSASSQWTEVAEWIRDTVKTFDVTF